MQGTGENMIERKKIKELISESLNELVRYDGELITRNVREECINHRFAIYLERNLKTFNIHGYDVDLEYNKNKSRPKEVLLDQGKNLKAIRPDIIVHKRIRNDSNLIAFEIKKSYTTKYDYEKIIGLLRKPYEYSYGCLVSYLPQKDYTRVKLLSSGGDQSETIKILS
jgi:hypothetical protein